MKKVVIIAIVVILLLLATLIAVPVFFKEPLLQATKTTINKNINAKVEFSGFNLSLFRNFPMASLELSNVVVSGVGNFAGDTLLVIPSLNSRFSLMSLFHWHDMSIEELKLQNPVLKLKVDSLGNDNWEITKEADSRKEVTQTTSTVNTENSNNFEIQLQKIKISDATVIYDDRSLPLLLSCRGTQLDLKGKMFGSSTELSGDATVAKFLLNYDSVTYVSNVSVRTNTVVDIDFRNWIYAIKESQWWVNKLPFLLSGDVRMPGDSLLFNLSFQAQKSSLGDFLTLVPPDYEKYLKGVETDGSATMSGYFKGLYLDEEYPAFSFNFKIDDGRIDYPGLPEDIKNISANISIVKTQGKLDLMEFDIDNTHAELAGNPVDLSAKLSNIYSDLNFDFGVKGKLDFGRLKKALPLQDLPVDGVVDVNLSGKGDYSSIGKKQYDRITGGGKIVLSDVSYSGDKLTKPLKISSGSLQFSPSDILLSDAKISVGSSDLSVSGKISDYLGYLFNSGILSGDLRFRSDNLNINELMGLMPQSKDTSSVNKSPLTPTNQDTTKKFIPVTVPADYDFKVSAEIGKAQYENLVLSNIRAEASVANGTATLEQLSLNIPGSEVLLSGKYGSKKGKVPAFLAKGTIHSLDIASVYNSVPELGKIAPEAARASGKLDADFSIEGEAGSEIKINSMSGSVSLTGFHYTNPKLNYPVSVPSGKLDFTSSEVTLTQLKVLIGSSDMTLAGKVSGFKDYYNSKGILSGGLRLTSDFMNFNELMNLQVEENKQTAVDPPSKGQSPAKTKPADSLATAFTVPANLDLAFTTNISRAVYDRSVITDINGNVTVSKGILKLEGLDMKMLGGELRTNGSYANNEQGNPDVDLRFSANNFDIPAASRSVKFFHDILPVSDQSTGKFSADFNMKGKLNPDMSVNFPTVNGEGNFHTNGLRIVNSQLLAQLTGIINKEKLTNVKVDDLNADFTVKNGNLLLKPFNTKVAGQETKVSGNINAENIVNMRLDFNIQREALGSDVQKLLAIVPGQENIKLIPASVDISGPVKKPSVKPDLSAAEKMIADQAKKSAGESLKKLGNSLKKLIDKK